MAEFAGVPDALLRDGARLGGVLIASASAAGLHALGAPQVRTSGAYAIDAILLLEGGHAALHTLPERAVILVDVLAPVQFDLAPALEVFTRRLAFGDVRAERLVRG